MLESGARYPLVEMGENGGAILRFDANSRGSVSESHDAQTVLQAAAKQAHINGAISIGKYTASMFFATNEIAHEFSAIFEDEPAAAVWHALNERPYVVRSV